jgi:hypothetical protein
MPVTKVSPSGDHPVPYSLDADEADTYVDEVAVAARTAEMLESLGATVEIDEVTLEREKALVERVAKKQDKEPLKNFSTALAAGEFLKSYAQNLAYDVNQVRAALTNKLLEIANCGDTKYELKAIELLGKHSDIGLFTERSEVTVNYNSPDALESAIKERVKRLLNANTIDVPLLGTDLDDELGVYAPEEEPEEEEEEEAND